MKKFVASTLLALGVIAFATPVLADEDVKKLEGQLIPVGEENKYRYSYDSWNITTDPIGFVYGKFSVGLTYAINDVIAIRTDVDLYKPYAEGSGVGGGAAVAGTLYFKKMYDGFFVEPGARIFGMDDGSLLYGPMINIGWHWIWDSGMNVALAAGAGHTWVSGGIGGSDTFSGTLPTGYLRIGKTF